jgi:signal transduction histidine kinase
MISSQLERILGKLDGLDNLNLGILAQLLAKERRLLETVFNAVREGIVLVNRQGIMDYANKAAFDLLGIQDKDLGHLLLWKAVPDLIPVLPVGFFEKQANQELRSAISREFELRYPMHRHIRLYGTPLMDTKGRLPEKENSYWALILTDITEDKVSVEERIENEKVSSIMMLAAGVAHEFGNPLNAISIHLQVAKRELAQKRLGASVVHQLKRSVDVCLQEVERLDGIIKHFLAAIRPHPPDRQAVDAKQILDEVLEVLGQELQNLEICVHIDCGPFVPPILADPNQLKQVFFNLLHNAAEAMDHGGTIRIKFVQGSEYLCVIISDTGKGINSHQLNHVFDPYYSTKGTGHGGLGLMIVQRIVRDHHAKIGIESLENVGTCVTLFWPLVHVQLPQLPAASETLRLVQEEP